MKAALSDNVDNVELLLNAGADVDAENEVIVDLLLAVLFV